MAGDAPRRHLATLDILRLIAALSVVVFHYFFRGAAGEGYLDASYPEVSGLALYGYLGVNLFFLISGFVIAWSAGGRDWRDFALARFVRLFPGYVVSMTITFMVLLAAASVHFPTGLADYAANLTFFAPAFGRPFMDGVYWSIVIELVFYGWIALALMSGLYGRFKLEMVAAWLAISCLNEFVLQSGALRMLALTEFAPWFAAGIVTHHITAKGRSAEAVSLLAAAFLISCATAHVTQAWMAAHYGQAVPTAGLVLSNAGIFGLMFVAVRWPDLVPASGLAAAAGALTYPLYLLHQNVGYLAINALVPAIGRWGAALFTIVVMFALAYGVWRFAERPVQRAIRHWLSRLHLAGFLPIGRTA